jgi:hypothetical protein
LWYNFIGGDTMAFTIEDISAKFKVSWEEAAVICGYFFQMGYTAMAEDLRRHLDSMRDGMDEVEGWSKLYKKIAAENAHKVPAVADHQPEPLEADDLAVVQLNQAGATHNI